MPDVYDVLTTSSVNVYDVLTTLRVYDVLTTDRYLARLREEGGRDLVMKERRLRIHLVPFFGDKPLSQIASFDIEKYKQTRMQESAKPGTVNRELACLSHLFNKAVEWRWLDKRPATIRRLKEDSGRIVYLTVEQVQRLVEASKHPERSDISVRRNWP